MNHILKPGTHPDADQLSTFAAGAASPHEREAMVAHLADCPECRSVVFLMQAQEETPFPAEKKTRSWTWRWLMPAGLAGAALACGLAVVVYVRTHPPAPQVAVNHAPVQTPAASGKEAPARTQGEAAQPQAGKHPREQAHAAAPDVTQRAGLNAPAGSMTQAHAPEERAAETPQASAVVSSLPPPAAAPVPASPQSAQPTESPRIPAEASNAAAASGLAGPNPLPGLRIEHDRGPNDGTSEVSGLVTDQTGAAVSGAAVTLRDQAGQARQTTSSGDGSFNLAGVAPGHYELIVQASGFQAYRQTMDLKPRDMAMLDTKLTVGSESQTVSVQANALAVQTESSEVAKTISSEQISNIATANRNFGALAAKPMHPGEAALPSNKPAAMTVALGQRVLSLDTEGTLFASHDGGRKWKKVKPRWAGNVARIESANSEAARKKAGAGGAPAVFQLTTVDGAVWLSKDGRHWRAR